MATSSFAGGGPDAGGYVWREAPFFDIDTANADEVSLGDDVARTVDLDFSFPFYSVDYDEVWVASNGYIAFEFPDITFLNECPLPNPGMPNGSLYVYWDDLVPPAGGAVLAETRGAEPYRHFVVTFDNVALFGSAAKLTAQAVLTETTGWMQLAFADAAEGGFDATVGIENQDGTAGLTVGCDGFFLTDGDAIFLGRLPVTNVRGEGNEAGFFLAWDDPTAAERYEVERQAPGEAGYTFLAETYEPRAFDGGLAECEAARYRVTAFAGEIGAAPPVESAQYFRPLAPVDPRAVFIDGTGAVVTWIDRSGCEDEYVIERRTGGEFAAIGMAPAGGQSFVDPSPPPDAVYRIVAHAELAFGEPSDEAPIGARLFAPGGLNALAESPVRVRLSFTDASEGETGYAIERATDDGVFAIVGHAAPNAVTWLDTTAMPDSAYEYRVRAVAGNLDGPPSNTAFVKTPVKPDDNDDDADDDDDLNDDESDDDASSSNDDGDDGCCGC
ncbi:fibronectin type III domain-containing protein [bacterium]|nr:fibronectin type III domain-containing protein [bacterium]